MRDGGTEHILAGGSSTNTNIRNDGTENVQGASAGTIVNGGLENVLNGGATRGTVINHGTEKIHGGASSAGTILNGGKEVVQSGGTATGTIINHGTESIEKGGTANNIIFAGPAHGDVELATPTGLKGTITNWQVGDVIHFLDTVVSDVHQRGDVLTVDFGNQNASYLLAGEQDDTKFKLRSDGHGGTDLILVPIVGAHHSHGIHHWSGESGHLIDA